MEQAKSFRHKTRQRIASLPDTSLGVICTSPERLGDISSTPKLPRNFPTGKRHTIHVAYNSSMQDLTEQFKCFLNHSTDFHAELQGEGDTIKGRLYSDKESQHAHLPALQKSPLTFDLPLAKKPTHLKRMHSGGDERRTETPCHEWPRVSSEGNHSLHSTSTVQGTRPTFPQIRGQVKDYRRNSLPVATENRTDLNWMFSPSSAHLGEGREAQTKAADPLPQVTQGSFVNLTPKQADKYSLDESESQLKDMGSLRCVRSNQKRPCAKDNLEGNDEDNDKVQALSRHIEEVETGFNEVEARAVRLFEWLRDQSDKDS